MTSRISDPRVDRPVQGATIVVNMKVYGEMAQKLAPYLIAVLMPGGLVLAPLLFLRQRRAQAGDRTSRAVLFGVLCGDRKYNDNASRLSTFFRTLNPWKATR